MRWRDTVAWLKWNHTTDFLPNPARIIAVAEEMSRAEEAKKRSQARLRDIVEQPEPELVTGPAEYGNVLRMLRGEGGNGVDGADGADDPRDAWMETVAVGHAGKWAWRHLGGQPAY